MKPGAVKKAGQGLEAALTSLMALDNVQVTVGLQGTAKTTANGESTPGEVVEIATANEYGYGVPARPFMRTSVPRHGKKWIKRWGVIVRAVTAEDKPKADQALRLVGLQMVGDVQATLNKGPWRENSEETIKAKGSDQPLVDTGQMKQSIRSQVEIPGQNPVVVG